MCFCWWAKRRWKSWILGVAPWLSSISQQTCIQHSIRPCVGIWNENTRPWHITIRIFHTLLPNLFLFFLSLWLSHFENCVSCKRTFAFLPTLEVSGNATKPGINIRRFFSPSRFWARPRTQFWRYLIASVVICQPIASDPKGTAHFGTAFNGLCLPACNNGKLDAGARLKRRRRLNARVFRCW